MMLYAFDPGYQLNAANSIPMSAPPAILTNMDSLMDQTKKLIPGVKINYINFPRNPGEAISVMGDLPGGWLWGETTSYVEYEYITGKVREVFLENELSLTEKIEYALYTLHYGQYGGKAIKIMYSFFGLSGAILTISGFLLWYRRKRTKNNKRQAPTKISKRFSPTSIEQNEY